MNLLDQYLNRGYEEELLLLKQQSVMLSEQILRLDSDYFQSSTKSHYRFQNLEQLLKQFQFHVNQSAINFEKEKIDIYTTHYNEARRISDYIVEYTRNLLSLELTSYRERIVEITESRNLIKRIGMTVSIISLLTCILFYFIIYHGISLPIRHLVKRSERIAKGDFNVRDLQVERKDEIGVLMQAYVVMGKNIEGLLEKVKKQEESKRLLQEMELRSLQSQINPHFLFNTLNLISRVAYIEKASKTEELMDSMSKLLRYNLQKMGEHVTLKEELNVIDQYLYIQKYRFQDRIQVEKDIDPACLDIKIPVFILQPLVENIFVHGIKSYESDAKILIRIFEREKEVYVEIWDNGVGIPQQTIESILNQKVPKHSSSKGSTTKIGMNNVCRRLQLFYNKQNVLEIDSSESKGTTIRLVLPRKAS